MRRRLTLVAFWAGGTLVAMLLAAFAVQLASAKVIDHPQATRSRKQVESDLQAAEAAAATSTSTSTVVLGDAASGGFDPSSPGSASATSIVPGTPGGPAGATPAPAPGQNLPAGDDATRRTTTTVTPVGGVTTTTPGEDSPGGGGPTHPGGGSPGGPPTTTIPPGPPPTSQQTFDFTGGSVTVRCEGSNASLVGAPEPNAGFTSIIKTNTPQLIEVHFHRNSPSYDAVLKMHCNNGAIVVEQNQQSGNA